jgi:phosphatidylglycerophosphate synthase
MGYIASMNEQDKQTLSGKFSFEKTLKTKPDDSFLNIQSYFFISSKQITRLLFYTKITPHQVIFVSMLFGLAAAYLLIQDNIYFVIAGAVLLFYKNVLDKVDGSLARAKDLASRRGRFYDSISDFMVSFAVFTAIGYKLTVIYNNPVFYFVSFIALVFSMLQCSFFIYYQVAFIKYSGKNTINRLLENVTEEDIKHQDKLTTLLQRIFQVIYGWQDYLMFKLDMNFMNKLKPQFNDKQRFLKLWYRDKPFLTLASILSIGSHMVLIGVFAIAGRLEYYLFVNLILWNLLLGLAVIYHYKSIKNKVKGLI